jgi:pantothenate kinase
VENPLENGVDKNDVARSLLTMVSINTLMLSKMIAQLEGIKNVVWIGSHIDILEYMQMAQYLF